MMAHAKDDLSPADPAFGRSISPFFHHDTTKHAVITLAKVKSLVIYCGAGVTIDRTGLSWSRLIAELLRLEIQDEDDGDASSKHANESIDREIDALCENLTPLQLASALSELGRIHRGDPESCLSRMVDRMRGLLYRHSGWQSGALVRNIIRLAVGFIGLDRRVVIVTTNYDDYLETEFDDYCKELKRNWRARGEAPPELPGLLVKALGFKRPLVNRAGSSTLEQLQILYLHGRISHRGGQSGHIILSERDYHASHEQVTDALTQLFNKKESGVLILGSSLTDPPLLTALAATHTRSNRFALIPAQATRMTTFSHEQFLRLRQHVIRRGDHFSTKFLMPDFHYQIAQFCEEVVTSVGLDSGPDSYIEEASGVRYGLRLTAWWDRWVTVDRQRGAEGTYRLMAERLAEVRKALSRQKTSDADGASERLKIELWVRNLPVDHRQLALWASSAGVLFDRSVLKTEELVLGSRSASMRAFLEGQPQYVSQEALIKGENASESSFSRWRSFLSVPIRIANSDDSVPVGLPVGVVTLATTAEKRASSINYRSTVDMEQLVDVLRVLGQELLQA